MGTGFNFSALWSTLAILAGIVVGLAIVVGLVSLAFVIAL